MGAYDSFYGKQDIEAQIKCFGVDMQRYNPGDKVPVADCGLPQNCTLCEWGGNKHSPFKSINLIGQEERMGTFVIIKDGKLFDVTTELEAVIYPVYDKYGDLLAETKEGHSER